MNIIKTRDSNMELLRLISIIFVLIFHTNILSLGIPDNNESIFSTYIRLFIDTATIVCVNTFILISGWYGIRFQLKKLFEFLFQIFFITAISIIININIWNHALCFDDIKNLFMLNIDILWFPKSYILLYILSPILNAYIANAKKIDFFTLIILFVLFQLIYGWCFDAVGWFREGYSAIFFMELYLIARYIRLYGQKIQNYKTHIYITLYIILCISLASIWFVCIRNSINITKYVHVYTSPFAIIGAILLIIAFSKLKFSNRHINMLAKYSFAVYLCHCAPGMLGHYVCHVRNIYNSCTIFEFIFQIVLTIIFIYIIAIVVDKIRIYLWNSIFTIIQNKHGERTK